MMLPTELMPVFEGAFPSCIATGSAEGIPNIANLTRVWYVEPGCVAIANQLLNKTYRNLMEHPLALIKIMNPHDWIHWEISVRYLRSEREGSLFEQIRQDLVTVSWVAGVQLPAELKSVLIFEIVSVRQCVEESLHLKPAPEIYGDLLQVLATVHGWRWLSYWTPAEPGQEVTLQASRGVAGAGVDPAAFDAMKRMAMLAARERRIIRLNNIRSQLRYLHSIRSHTREQEERPAIPVTDTTPSSYLAFPVTAFNSVIGIICCEEAGGLSDIHTLEDRYLSLLAARLGKRCPGFHPYPMRSGKRCSGR
ncbi:hypothetical protein LJK87_28825 [Paenibacillus sp. P25]|nr:hypothetical protein LJK87_28825 [Paenibacillus sp. P25]